MKNIKNKLNPKTAKPATPSPITVPPPKATSSAFGRLVLAAWVVLLFASVAILIPMLPANPENIAPTINAGIINQLVVSTTKEIPNRAADANTTKINKSLYSAFKKAKAPFFIAELIETIFSFPGSCFFTHWALKNI